MPRREPRRPTLRRYGRRLRPALPVGGEHPAWNDADLAGARHRSTCRHWLRRAGRMDRGECLMRGVRGTALRRPRRSGFAARLQRFGWWIAIPVLLSGGLFGMYQLSRSPFGQAMLQHSADRMLDGTARLGLVVTDIRVEGRETTDRETILTALGARPGTPILAMSPRRAKEQLETLPWVRSAVVERRLPDTLYVRLIERRPLALWQHG